MGLGTLFNASAPVVRAVDYRRVSSEEQATEEHFSLAAQTQRCADFIAHKGWQHAGSFEDAGRSGKSIYRPAFQDMLAAAARHEFDVVVVHKIDRFSRNLTDFLVVLRELKQHNVKFVSVSEDMDFTTGVGELVLIVLAWLAQWYLDNLRAEVKKGKRERARQGHWNGTLVFGYTTPARLRAHLTLLGEQFRAGAIDRPRYEQEAAMIENVLEQFAHAIDSAAIPDPYTASVIPQLFRKYATGQQSGRELAQWLNAQGFRTGGVHGERSFTTETVRSILINRFYLGEVRYAPKGTAQDEVYVGAHVPLISPELFDAAMRARIDRAPEAGYSRRGKQVYDYALGGLVRCAHCGERLNAAAPHGIRQYRDVTRMKGGTCDSTVRAVRADDLEAQVGELLRAIHVPDEWTRHLDALPVQRDHDVQRQRQHYQKRITRLQRLYELGDIPEQAYLLRRNYLARAVDALPEAVPNTPNPRRLKQFLNNVNQLWDVATAAEQHQLARMMFRSIYVNHGKIVAVEASPLFWATVSAGTKNGDLVRRRPDSANTWLSSEAVSLKIIVPPGAAWTTVYEYLRTG